MNTLDDQDRELEAVLRRTAGYLTHHGTEYLERSDDHPRPEPTVNRQGRLVLVAGMAAAALCGVAVAASFIGNTSSGTVDVAEAAWSAVPAAAPLEGAEHLDRMCRTVVEQEFDNFVAEYGGAVEVAATKPQLVASEARGSSLSGLYFAGSYRFGSMCLALDGAPSAVAIGVDLGDGDRTNGSVAMRSFSPADSSEIYTLFTGYLPTMLPAQELSATVYLDGQPEAIIATIDQQYGRYIAWTPSEASGRVTFFESATGDALFSLCTSDVAGAMMCENHP